MHNDSSQDLDRLCHEVLPSIYALNIDELPVIHSMGFQQVASVQTGFELLQPKMPGWATSNVS